MVIGLDGCCPVLAVLNEDYICITRVSTVGSNFSLSKFDHEKEQKFPQC